MNKQDKLDKKRWKMFAKKCKQYQQQRTSFFIYTYGKNYMKVKFRVRENKWRSIYNKWLNSIYLELF